MARHILKCQKCGGYTLNPTCKCGGTAVPPAPARYSPQDAYGEYRRRAKQQEWIERGLL